MCFFFSNFAVGIYRRNPRLSEESEESEGAEGSEETSKQSNNQTIKQYNYYGRETRSIR